MKKIMILVAIVFSLSAMAKEKVSFTYFGNEGGRQSFYSCDYAQSQTEYFLELFGATNIDVNCFGGIQPWSFNPVSVSASFELPVVAGQSAEESVVKGDNWNPACGLNVRIVNEVVKKFKNVQIVSKDDACAFSTSNYYYKFSITR